jgi:hypothetical protein
VQDSQIGRADSMSPSGTALLRSGNVQATSYMCSSRGRATVVTRRNVQRRRGVAVAAPGCAEAGGYGRGMSAMPGTVVARKWCDKATSSTTTVDPLVGRLPLAKIPLCELDLR